MSESGRVSELQILKRVAQHELVRLLEEFTGDKDLIIDETLMKPLDRIAGASVLRAHGVDKIFKLDPISPARFGEHPQQVFLVRATMRNAKALADAINSTRSSNNRSFGVIFVPRKLAVCTRVLEREGVLGAALKVESFNPSLIPLDSDLLSLEAPDFFRSFFVDGCLDGVYAVAHSLWHLQSLFGPVSHLIGVGRAADAALKLMDTLYWEHGEARHQADYLFSHLFLVDRDIDFASVFLSALTYEALIDESFEIACGVVEFPGEVVKQEKPVKILLTSSDEVFDTIRNRHFSTVLPILGARAREVQAGYEKRNTKDVGVLKQFVSTQLQGLRVQHRSVALHIGACETILAKKKRQGFEEQLQAEHKIMVGGGAYRESVSFIEDLMAAQAPEYLPLSLLVLLSLTQQGIPTKDLSSLRTQFLHAYGHRSLGVFAKLKRLGILVEQSAAPSVTDKIRQLQPAPASTFPALVKRLGLYARSADVDIRTPTDFSYVYNGAYVPAIVQLVAQTLQSGFASVDLARAMPAGYPLVHRTTARQTPIVDATKIVMIYFLGGVTYAEIATLRLLAKLKGYKIVVATTNVVTRGVVLRDLQEL